MDPSRSLLASLYPISEPQPIVQKRDVQPPAIIVPLSHPVTRIRWQDPQEASLANDGCSFIATIGPCGNTNGDLCILKVDPQKRTTACVASQPLAAAAMDIKWVTPLDMLVATAQGNICQFRASKFEASHPMSLKEEPMWDHVHNGAVNRIAVAEHIPVVATAGDDHNIKVFSWETRQAIIALEEADDWPVYGLEFTSGGRELLSAGTCLKFWDTRARTTSTPIILEEDSPLPNIYHSVNIHPSRPHLIVGGMTDGRVIFWDRRDTRKPYLVIHSKSGPVWRTQFHPTSSHLLTCGQDPNILLWSLAESNTGMYVLVYVLNKEGDGTLRPTVQCQEIEELNCFGPLVDGDIHASRDMLAVATKTNCVVFLFPLLSL